ncbi:MAG: MarR family transcriptional regulator [Hyphomicrobiaceae bacterium]|nr:MarR family transcriptional regulator [Hyphomicrobiaceae bacterium]
MDDIAAGAGMLELERFLPYRLAVLAGEVSRALSQIYTREFGLSIPEWRIVANLGRFGPLNAGDLAQRSSLDKPKVTRALQKLEARGLVVRSVEARDRRQVRLSLSRRGRSMLGQIAGLALDWEKELVSVLSHGDREHLARIMAALSARTEALSARKPGRSGAAAG